MAITLLQLNEKLAGVLKETGTGGPGLGHAMLIAANDANALFKKRIQESGKNAKGQMFRPYSTKPLAVNRGTFKSDKAYNAVAGSKGKRKNLDWFTSKDGKKMFWLSGGYKQFRDLHERQTQFVDFTFSGEMMGNIKVKSSSSQHNSGVAIIGATKDDEIKKLESNIARRGEIMELSESEAGDVAKILESELINYWKKYQLV